MPRTTADNESDERPSKTRKLSHDGYRDSQSHPSQISSSTVSASSEVSMETHAALRCPEQDVTAQGPDINNMNHEPRTQDGVESIENHAHESGDVTNLPAPDTTAPLVNTAQQHQGDPPLSKSQQKKLRKQAEWDSKRDERKAIRKEKQVAKRERKRAEKQQAAAEAPDETIERPVPPKAVLLPITIVIDCDFDDLMRDNERVSLASQITRCYSDNKNSRVRAHLTVCSFGGKLRHRFDNILTHYQSWRGVRTLDCDFVETGAKAEEWMLGEDGGQLAGVFSKYAEIDESAQAELKDNGELVYLSSESDDTLTELKPYSTYIIGGLVDKNREKGVCYKRATQRGVRTARLPIGEYMDMTSRKVLATNHVNEIMLKWLECGDWGEAFLKVIPKRKGGKLKDAEADDDLPVDGELITRG